MSSPDFERFGRDGYLIGREVVSHDTCVILLAELIEALSGAQWSYVHESKFRAHCPLRLTAQVRELVRVIVRKFYPVLSSFLTRGQSLVELSSLTVFPNARSQGIHADENETGKNIITVFVNLVPTSRNAGALLVLPGSHKGRTEESRLLEVPAGSAILMNGKLQHAGTANSSVDRIRPVVYFSFGDNDIAGPAYSIRPEYRHRFTIADFHTSALNATSTPILRTGYWTAIKLDREREGRQLVFMNGSSVEHGVEIHGDELWMVSLFEMLSSRGTARSVENLASTLNIDREIMCNRLIEFADMGVITW